MKVGVASAVAAPPRTPRAGSGSWAPPKSGDLGVHVFPPEGQPYLERMEHIGDTPGLAPIVHDVSLTRGIPVRGRLIDQVSRRPVRGVVHYFVLDINPRYGELRWSLSFCQVPAGVAARSRSSPWTARGCWPPQRHSDRFTKGAGVDRFKVAKPSNPDPKTGLGWYVALPVDAYAGYFDTLVELDLPADALEQHELHDRADPLKLTWAACGLEPRPSPAVAVVEWSRS